MSWLALPVHISVVQGVPLSLQQLIDAGKNSDLYNNTRRSMWKPSAQTVVSELELTTLDTVLVNNHVKMHSDSENHSYVLSVLHSLVEQREIIKQAPDCLNFPLKDGEREREEERDRQTDRQRHRDRDTI